MSTPKRTITLQPLAVSQEDIDSFAEKLCDLACGFGIELSHEIAAICVEHVAYVDQVNQYINLTRITDMDEALVLHILDSLLFAPLIEKGRTRFLDMGTGAGFPGIPLHLVSDLPGVLLDSVGKKINAVSAFIDMLGLHDLTAVHDRLESYAAEHRGSFDLVVARAVAPLGVLLEYASPILAHGGQLLISKGNPDQLEIDQGHTVARICGFELHGRESLELPDGRGHREFFSYIKVSTPSISLPRQVGEARRHPLG